MTTLLQDIRYAVRLLLRNPGFAALTALTLALGIGANTAIFSVLSAILLRPLPFKDSSRLTFVWTTMPGGCDACWHNEIGFSDPNFLDLHDQNNVFEEMGAFEGAAFTLTGVDHPHYIKGGAATAGFFPTLGIEPLLGRTFRPDDEQEGKRVVVLSHGLWKERFGSDRTIVGSLIHLDTIPYTVIGVLPPASDLVMPGHYGARDLWVPAVLSSNAPRGSNHLNVIARIKTGVTLRQAQENASVIMVRLAKQYHDAADFNVNLVPAQREVTSDIRPVLLILFGAAGFLLLIACANAANLQLTRASGRQKEISIRTALGASRVRLVRQLLTESVILALIGGTGGVWLAFWGRRLLLRLSPGGWMQVAVPFDSPVLGYSLALSLLTGLLFGLAPALRCTTARWNEALKVPGTTSAAGEEGSGARSFLTVAQMALSLALLAGAGLLLRSFAGLLRVDPGFSTRKVVTALFDLPKYSYPDQEKQAGFYRELMEQIRTLPGVKAVAAIDDLPLTSDSDSDRLTIADHPQFNTEKNYATPQERLVTPDYFRAMSIPLIAGRMFSEADNLRGEPVVIVNQNFARRLFASEDPIGQRLMFGPPTSQNPWMTVVGVVGDVRDSSLASEPGIEIYASYLQKTLRYNPLPHMNLIVLTAADDKSVVNGLLQKVRILDKDLPAPAARPMDSVYAASIAARRFSMLLLGLFAGLAVLLAGIGIYGVISFSVARRTREIGIRMALGAPRRRILQLVLYRGMMLATIGVVAGVSLALALTRVLAGMLFGVSTTDALTFVSVALLLLAVALGATYLPARRATKVDPLLALRSE
jgi:putative ABC transport system permease protein